MSDASAVPIVADLSRRSDCHRAIDEALAADPRLDILISNAAPPRDVEPFLEMRAETWDEDLAVNLTASYLLGQRAGQVMKEQGGGVILYTASISASGASRGLASYCVTKAGIVALVKSMALDLAPFGIRVNCVSPGPADTQRSVDLVGEEMMVKFRENFAAVPMNRLASADDVARAFLYLASEDAAYVTGHNLVVDGGLLAQVYEVLEA
jgi:3-oxoacyl-[acyl-carrier protein] reductase